MMRAGNHCNCTVILLAELGNLGREILGLLECYLCLRPILVEIYY